MSRVRSKPVPVKLFIGMISADVPLFKKLKAELRKLYGPLGMESPVFNWSHTDYYLKEMGSGLKRQFIFFKELIDPGVISDIKLKTVELENEFLNKEGGRRINLDPGYMDSARVVLVSAKDFSHRLFLRNNIYGEVTLVYSGNSYRILPYTYPDFKKPEYLDIFEKARVQYKRELSG